MPNILIIFGVVAIVAIMLSFSIARLPLGLGSIFREALGCWWLLLLFWLVTRVLRAVAHGSPFSIPL